MNSYSHWEPASEELLMICLFKVNLLFLNKTSTIPSNHAESLSAEYLPSKEIVFQSVLTEINFRTSSARVPFGSNANFYYKLPTTLRDKLVTMQRRIIFNLSGTTLRKPESA